MAISLPQADDGEELLVTPPRGWQLPDLRELWRYRDLLYFLCRREIVIRHQQAVVGVLWALIQPLFLAALFAFFFGLLEKAPSEHGIPYGLFAISGLVVWLAFSKTVEASTTSTITHEPLITKIYLPRLVLPLAAVAVPILDLVVGLVVITVYALTAGIFPDARILLVPFILALALALAAGFGVWLSALNVKYRDFGLLMPNLMLAGLFVTPITYPFSLVPENLQTIYGLNPMVGVLELFRWSFFGVPLPDIWPFLVAVPLVMAPLLLLSGAVYFERASRNFADVI